MGANSLPFSAKLVIHLIRRVNNAGAKAPGRCKSLREKENPHLFAEARGATPCRVYGCCIQRVTRQCGIPEAICGFQISIQAPKCATHGLLFVSNPSGHTTPEPGSLSDPLKRVVGRKNAVRDNFSVSLRENTDPTTLGHWYSMPEGRYAACLEREPLPPDYGGPVSGRLVTTEISLESMEQKNPSRSG